VSEVELNEPPVGGYSVTLPTFEGPLDLLLHLCQKHELDILDIPIGFVTEKYLEYLAVMQLMNLDVASEYLVMAATLAHIKSKMLLPAPPPGQEDELVAEEDDPREALIRRLLEYQKYKHAGEELSARGTAQQNVFMRGMPIEEAVHTGLPPLAQVPLFSLVEAFQSVLSKSQVKLSHDIVHERVTLADRINELVDILRVRRRVTFEELFVGLNTRFDLVITFLALLEMTRLRMTRLFQADFESQIWIEFTAQVNEEHLGEIEGVEALRTPVTADDDVEPGAAATPAEEGQANGAEPTSASDTEPPPAHASGDEAYESTGSFYTDAPPPERLATEGEAVMTPTQTIPAPSDEQDVRAASELDRFGDRAPHTITGDPPEAAADALASDTNTSDPVDGTPDATASSASTTENEIVAPSTLADNPDDAGDDIT
jgi:segregation and condensation protein A